MIRALLIVGLALASLGAPAAASAKGPVSLVWGGDVTLGSSYGLPPDAGWPQRRVRRVLDIFVERADER